MRLFDWFSQDRGKNQKCVDPEGGDIPTSRRIAFLAAQITIGFFLLVVIIWIIAQIWPYKDLSIEDIGQARTEEFTSTGVPVLREGVDLRYSVDYCNSGVTISTVRWLDSYGSIDDVTPLKQKPEVFSSSRLLSQTIFPITKSTTGCFEDVPIRLFLDLGVPTGTFYKLRTLNTYKPNFLADVTYEATTPLFYYAEKGADIP